MSWLTNLLSSRKKRDAVLDTVAQVIRLASDGAKTIAEVRERLARHAQQGDLDKAIVALSDSETIARDYIERG